MWRWVLSQLVWVKDLLKNILKDRPYIRPLNLQKSDKLLGQHHRVRQKDQEQKLHRLEKLLQHLRADFITPTVQPRLLQADLPQLYRGITSCDYSPGAKDIAEQLLVCRKAEQLVFQDVDWLEISEKCAKALIVLPQNPPSRQQVQTGYQAVWSQWQFGKAHLLQDFQRRAAIPVCYYCL